MCGYIFKERTVAFVNHLIINFIKSEEIEENFKIKQRMSESIFLTNKNLFITGMKLIFFSFIRNIMSHCISATEN